MDEKNNEFFGRDDFLLAKVISDVDKRPKPKTGGPTNPEYIEFDGPGDSDDWKKNELKRQVKNTVSILEKKTMRQGDQIFFEVYPKAKPNSYEVRKMLDRFDAEIIGYRNNNNLLLVSASNRVLTRLVHEKIPAYVSDFLYMIKPLVPKEQISDEIEEKSNSIQMIIISLMPNIKSERREQYVKKVYDFLEKEKHETYEKDLSKNGFIITDTTKQVMDQLAEDSTFIYKINPIPKGIAKSIRSNNKKLKKGEVLGKPASFTNIESKELSTVVLMDSGVNKIKSLENILTTEDGYNFSELDDGFPNHGHGTPIAHLLAHGENGSVAAVKIISYKIYDQKNRTVALQGYKRGIEKYAKTTKLFLSSIGLEGLDDLETVYLERLVQENNICFVCSGGNIDRDRLEKHLTTGPSYPQYIKLNSVEAPSNSVNFVSVGSITKKSNSSSIAPVNSLSPHSVCGSGGNILYECKKPEVVEHGGNLNIGNGLEFNSIDVGVKSVNKDGIEVNDLTGSSFAAPLFMRKIAKIEGKYGNQIHNSETLKAILFLSSKNDFGTCGGYGESKEFTGCNNNHALYLAEGTLGLFDVQGEQMIRPFNEIVIYVPPNVEKIKLCLVHSDNFKKSLEPTLNTWLSVETRKFGSDSIVELDNKTDVLRKTNVKILSKSFERNSMESVWRFKIKSHTTEPIHPKDRKGTIVRYGCAILLVGKDSRRSKTSLTDEIKSRRMRYTS